MWRLRRNTIGITLGDPCGIGPEIVAKALAHRSLSRAFPFLVIGDYGVYWHYHLRASKKNFLDLNNMPARKFTPGRSNPTAARASLESIHCAIQLIREKKITSLVTAPVSKEGISSLGVSFCGHTEYLAQAFGIKRFGMMFVPHGLPHMVMTLVTRHLPIAQVPQAISPGNVYETIALTFESLQKYFKIKHPCLAVCGLNPHAGEKGKIGNEESLRIIPAIQRANKNGMKVFGPLAADTLFFPKVASQYDGIVAMYHDQGLAPMKGLYFPNLVNLTMGLPFVRTSPAHGTAFDIAGRNLADPSSMRAAIELAVSLSA